VRRQRRFAWVVKSVSVGAEAQEAAPPTGNSSEFQNQSPVPTKLPLQPAPRNPLVLQEPAALTVKASTENREAKWLNFSQKLAFRPRGRQETFRGTRASRAAQGRYFRDKSSAPVGHDWGARWTSLRKHGKGCRRTRTAALGGYGDLAGRGADWNGRGDLSVGVHHEARDLATAECDLGGLAQAGAG